MRALGMRVLLSSSRKQNLPAFAIRPRLASFTAVPESVERQRGGQAGLLDGPAGRRCLSKNVWLFNKISPPANEYSVGIKTFVSSPNAKWSVVNLSVGDE
jgi:hypothetical protein